MDSVDMDPLYQKILKLPGSIFEILDLEELLEINLDPVEREKVEKRLGENKNTGGYQNLLRILSVLYQISKAYPFSIAKSDPHFPERGGRLATAFLGQLSEKSPRASLDFSTYQELKVANKRRFVEIWFTSQIGLIVYGLRGSEELQKGVASIPLEKFDSLIKTDAERLNTFVWLASLLITEYQNSVAVSFSQKTTKA